MPQTLRPCFLLAATALSWVVLAVPAPSRAAVPCDDDNGGLELPAGFCATVFATDLGPARHLAVAPNGDVYVSVRHRREPGGIVALRDVDGDGWADRRESFDGVGGTGLVLHDGYLYLARTSEVVRYRHELGELVPEGEAELLVKLPLQRSHAAKGLAFDSDGGLFVNVGAPSNACQEQDRTAGQAGQDPCPLLEKHGGVWRFDLEAAAASSEPLTQEQGRRFATGMRQNFAMDWHPTAGGLYLVQHGRDQLNTLWPELFTDAQNAELPSEEFLRVDEGSDFGWPYCHHDWQQEKRVLAPEYGGDGKEVGRCAQYPPPLLGFPGHWAPNDLHFYEGTQFPARYRGGGFVAFHGSWNRAPLPQQGFNLVFVPFEGGAPATGDYEVFAGGFSGREEITERDGAVHRPTGLAEGPSGSLYVASDKSGVVWRISYRGE